MRFMHILLRRFGTFSVRTPTYYVVNFLHSRGHENLILNGDYMVENDRRMFSYIGRVGKNIWENIIIATKALASHNYDVAIIYDTYDAICSHPFSLLKPLVYLIKKGKSGNTKKIIYYNIELFILDYKSYLKKKIGWILEQIFILGCDAFVSLSPLRLTLAQKIFNIPCRKFVVPNSPDFEAEEIRRTPSEPLKLLYTGGIEEYVFSGIDRLGHNQEFKFIIHGVSKYGIDALERKLKDRSYIEVHAEIIAEYERFKKYVAEHDVGFVWYNTERLNDKFAGWSSGKYFRYLSLGKPVIVRNMPELAETTIDNGFGSVIDGFEQIPEAVERIKDNYSSFVENILKNYHKFAFSPNFMQVYNFIL